MLNLIGIQVGKKIEDDQFQVVGIQGANKVGDRQFQVVGIQGANKVGDSQFQFLGIQVSKKVEADQLQGIGIQGANKVEGEQSQCLGGINIILGQGNQKTRVGVNLNFGHYRNSQKGLLNISIYGMSLGSNLFYRIRTARNNIATYSSAENLDVLNSKPSLFNKISGGKYHTTNDLERKILSKLNN